ncbi:MAG: hypothetical protein ABRQ27_00385 [Clostridiaceae bacterium]
MMKAKNVLNSFKKMDFILLFSVLALSFEKPSYGGILSWVLIFFLAVGHKDAVAAFIGNFLYRRKNFDKAIKWYKYAAKVRNTNITNIKNYIFLELKFGSIEKAQKTLKEIEENSIFTKEDLIEIKLSEATIYWKNNDINGAVRLLKPLMSNSNSSALYANLGYYMNYSNELDEALTFNSNAFKIYTNDMFIKFNLAQSYYLKGDYHSSLVLLDELIGLGARFPEPYFVKAMILKSQGFKDEAMSLFYKAYKIPSALMSYITKERISEELEAVNLDFK